MDYSTVLLTGATGTVGLATTEALLQRGHNVVGYALEPPLASARAALDRLPGAYTFVSGDILDSTRLTESILKHDAHTVIHGAALTPTADRERTRPDVTMRVNIEGPVRVAMAVHAASAHVSVRRLIHLGSVAAYGARTADSEILAEESDQERPESLYELSKLAGEQAALRVAQLHGIEAVSLRLGDIFGPWEHSTAHRGQMSAPFQVLAAALAGREIRLPRAGRKAWIYTRDVGRAIVTFVEAEHPPHGVVNVSTSATWSVADWCRALGRHLDVSFHIDTADPNIALFADNAPMSLTKLEATGFVAQYPLERATSDYLEWAQSFPEFLVTESST